MKKDSEVRLLFRARAKGDIPRGGCGEQRDECTDDSEVQNLITI